jgi:adenosylhomocysteine nucleosidase
MAQTFLGIVAAFEHETALVRRHMRLQHQQVTTVGTLWKGDLYSHHVVLLRCGMGPERAARATAWLVQSHRLQGAISVGFAGALQASLITGDAVLAQQLLSCPAESVATPLARTETITPDSRLVYIAATAATQAALVLHRGPLLSVNEVVPTAAAKQRLGRYSGALAVDMESYSVGQAAAEHNLPFVALRTIFDACDDDLSFQVGRFTTADGVLQPGRLMCYLGLQPRLFTQTLSLWRKARTAGNHLGAWLYHFLTLLSQETHGRFTP